MSAVDSFQSALSLPAPSLSLSCETTYSTGEESRDESCDIPSLHHSAIASGFPDSASLSPSSSAGPYMFHKTKKVRAHLFTGN